MYKKKKGMQWLCSVLGAISVVLMLLPSVIGVKATILLDVGILGFLAAVCGAIMVRNTNWYSSGGWIVVVLSLASLVLNRLCIPWRKHPEYLYYPEILGLQWGRTLFIVVGVVGFGIGMIVVFLARYRSRCVSR